MAKMRLFQCEIQRFCLHNQGYPPYSNLLAIDKIVSAKTMAKGKYSQRLDLSKLNVRLRAQGWPLLLSCDKATLQSAPEAAGCAKKTTLF